jgi:hypothetical protein
VRLKHSSKTNPRWLLDGKTDTANGNKENEPTRRRIYNRTTPREKGGLGISEMGHFYCTTISQ